MEKPVYFFFADDARQNSPTRDRMGPIVAAGGFLVSATKLKSLEARINVLCGKYGFPKNEDFKWSPTKGMWMKTNLIDKARKAFYLALMKIASEFEIEVIAVLADSNHRGASCKDCPEKDVTNMLLERIENRVKSIDGDVIVVLARPQGGREQEDKFLRECLEICQIGTSYVKPSHIAINVTFPPKTGPVESC